MPGDQSADAAPAAPQVPDLKALNEQLRLVIANPGAVDTSDDALRHEFQRLARTAAEELYDPFETLQRVMYSPFLLIAVRVAQQHKIIATLAASKDPVALDALQNATGLHYTVLESILDFLAIHNMISEVEPARYAATKVTNMLTLPVFQDAVTHFHDNCLPAFGALNTVLSSPDAKLNAFKTGQHSEHDFYSWLETHPVQQGAFHRFMEAQFASLPTWLDVVDFQAEMGEGLTATDVAFVDVAGGNGQQCDGLRRKFPGLQGRVVLQERPDVLAKALPVEGMEKDAYDYLTEQPVKDARVYYFRQIMHNNDDETCIRILRNQLPAMGPGSVVIIDDKALPDDKAPHGAPGVEYLAGLSLAMKAMFDAQERREGHWRELLGKAGLVVRDVRKFTKFHDAAIIAVKP